MKGYTAAAAAAVARRLFQRTARCLRKPLPKAVRLGMSPFGGDVGQGISLSKLHALLHLFVEWKES